MTNKEWLATLSDEEFILWLTQPIAINYTSRFTCMRINQTKVTEIKPYYPTLNEVTKNAENIKICLKNWLKEERKELQPEDITIVELV